MATRRILVLGSLNIDLVQHVPRLPQPGETLRGEDLAIHVGGKGANQACAAARLGGHAAMAGKVGGDVFAQRVLTELSASGVDTKYVNTSPKASGTATIFVLPSGENVIVIAAGANGDVSSNFASEAVSQLEAGDFLLCQLEIPLDTVSQSLTAAHARGVKTILDPAPAVDLPDAILRATTILTPNQTEAALLCRKADAPEDFESAELLARNLQARGAQTVVVKLGALGCLMVDGQSATRVPTFKVKPVDSTAAGDTFNGALAVALSEGLALADACRFANAAGALSVTKAGAISSIPARHEVDAMLTKQGAT